MWVWFDSKGKGGPGPRGSMRDVDVAQLNWGRMTDGGTRVW